MAVVTLPNGDHVLAGSVFDPSNSNYIPPASTNSGSSGGGGLSPQQQYQQTQATYAAQVATAAAAAKQAALQKAWQTNQQSLNSQSATVGNNYTSAINNLNATKAAQTPQYQTQRDAASADAATQLRKTQALNALSGKYFSGTNRSQMLGVDLAKEQAMGNINQSQNEFNTGITNQLSAADAQRVAALNDIASKLSLGQQQFAQGTYDINSQLASDQSTSALKAFQDSQTWADQQKQQGIDNSVRQAQLDQAAKIAELQQAFQQKQFDASQSNEANDLALKQAQLTGTYNGADTLAKQAQLADEAYKNAALSVKSGSGSKANNTANAYSDVYNAYQQGTPLGTVLANIASNAAGYAANGQNYTSIMALAKQLYGAQSDAYSASQNTPDALAQRQGNSLTNSAFTNW